MGIREMQSIGRGLFALSVGIGAYFLVDNGLEAASSGFGWAAGGGTVPYLNNVVNGFTGALDFLSEPAGALAGLYAAYRLNRR